MIHDPDDPTTWTPEARVAEHQRLEALANACCPSRLPHEYSHADPDNSGQCIYCGCILDIIEGMDY